MAYLLSSERPIAAAFSHSILATAFAWLGKVQARRARKVALSALLELEDYRLDDLGISRQDVMEAIRHPAPANGLASRRAVRAATVESNAISTALFEAGGTY